EDSRNNHRSDCDCGCWSFLPFEESMTIQGKHTIAELRDLLDAYNYQQSELEKAAAGAKDNWIYNNPMSQQAWQEDYNSWNISYQPVRTRANTVLGGTSSIFQNVETDEPTYQALAAAFLPMADLDKRFRASPVGSAAPQ